MKFFSTLFACGCMALDSTMLMLMMQNQGLQGSQSSQMNMMLPLLLLGDRDDSSAENSDMLMLMMMQGGNMGDMNSILPLLMLSDDSLDFKSLFLLTTMMKQGLFYIFCFTCLYSLF